MRTEIVLRLRETSSGLLCVASATGSLAGTGCSEGQIRYDFVFQFCNRQLRASAVITPPKLRPQFGERSSQSEGTWSRNGKPRCNL